MTTPELMAAVVAGCFVLDLGAAILTRLAVRQIAKRYGSLSARIDAAWTAIEAHASHLTTHDQRFGNQREFLRQHGERLDLNGTTLAQHTRSIDDLTAMHVDLEQRVARVEDPSIVFVPEPPPPRMIPQ